MRVPSHQGEFELSRGFELCLPRERRGQDGPIDLVLRETWVLDTGYEALDMRRSTVRTGRV